MTFDGAGDFQADGALGDYRGRNMHFGVREHAMCAAVNGMTLTGLRAFGSGLPDLHRLCARRDPSGVADGPAGAAHLDA